MSEEPESPTVPGGPTRRLATLPFLGPPPLVEGEDAAAYDVLLARICGALAPADILEEIWVRDVVDLVWETFRLRRLKANLMTACAGEGAANALARLLPGNSYEIARQWTARDEAACATVAAALAVTRLTREIVDARSVSLRIGEIDRIDRMITAAELRRHVALRELDRHRAALALGLRRAIAEIEEAEFAEAEFNVVAPAEPVPEPVG